ncbi:MAG: N-acetyl sugar amidotransferase [Verrucomicrobiales bacterium]|nr:N-acetyl sugar amidotransferase [Verrucomicrobiales bacterium]
MSELKQKILDRQIVSLPKTVVYCSRCAISNQRPRIKIGDDGLCSACRFSDEKDSSIDWKERGDELKKLCDLHRRNDGRWDIVVPCSGGKDASMVAHKLREDYGMHPLTVTWSPFEYTDIGWQNFREFNKAGFNNILLTPNGKLHRKLSRLGFEFVGDNFLPFIYGQMAAAFHVAHQFGIKLVFFGENGEAEYGGDSKNNYKRGMPLEDWANSYFKGLTVDELVKFGEEETSILSCSDYDQSDLQFYRPPDIDVLRKSEIEMHWFSYYEKWVPQENFFYASENTGFKANPEGRSQGTYSKYASLDDRMDGFHYYLGFIKFGLGRCTSDASHEVRDGHITREEAIALIKRFDGEFPNKYFEEFLGYIDIDEEKFWNIINKFRTPEVWTKESGEWRLRHAIYSLGADEEPVYSSSIPEGSRKFI